MQQDPMAHSCDFHTSDGPFYLGEENASLRSTIGALLDGSQVPSPVVLSGGSGSGKSEILSLVAQHWLEQQANVMATTAPDLYRSLNDAIKTGDALRLSRAYQAADLLAIDDIHRLARKSVPQQWLCQILDHRYRAQRITLVTASKPAGQLRGFSTRLISRLFAGLNVEVQMPGRGTRREIVADLMQAGARTLGSEVDVDRFVKDTHGLSVPEIRAMWRGQRGLSSDPDTDSRLHHRSVELPKEIMKATAKKFGVRFSDLTSPSRRKSIVAPRAVAMFLIRESTSLSLADVAQLFRRRDHTTVRHAYHKVRDALPEDETLCEAVDSIRRSVGILGVEQPLENAS